MDSIGSSAKQTTPHVSAAVLQPILSTTSATCTSGADLVAARWSKTACTAAVEASGSTHAARGCHARRASPRMGALSPVVPRSLSALDAPRAGEEPLPGVSSRSLAFVYGGRSFRQTALLCRVHRTHLR